MSSLEQKYINYLYDLLHRAKNPDIVAALRWAIFQLEQKFRQ